MLLNPKQDVQNLFSAYALDEYAIWMFLLEEAKYCRRAKIDMCDLRHVKLFALAVLVAIFTVFERRVLMLHQHIQNTFRTDKLKICFSYEHSNPIVIGTLMARVVTHLPGVKMVKYKKHVQCHNENCMYNILKATFKHFRLHTKSRCNEFVHFHPFPKYRAKSRFFFYFLLFFKRINSLFIANVFT